MIKLDIQFLDRSFNLEVFSSIHECSEEWDQIGDPQNVFLHSPFLRALENVKINGFTYLYLLVRENGQPKGILYCQINKFEAKNAIRFNGKGLWTNIKRFLSKRISFKTLVNGNLLITGENGFQLDQLGFSESDEWKFIFKILSSLRDELKRKELNIPFILAKDFYQKPVDRCFTPNGFKSFGVQPNMVLHLRPEWNAFEDYLDAIKSKYRIRLKKALKRGALLRRIEFDLEDILKNEPVLHKLYQNISESVNFNLFYLPIGYWAEMKRQLKSKMRFFVYLNENEIIAFFTEIDKGPELNAHFLGYRKEDIHQYDIYLNMLIDLIKLGIKGNRSSVNMSRTAMEIKSSVGAVPENMFLLYNHRNTLANKSFPFLLKLLNPTLEWNQRNPFK